MEATEPYFALGEHPAPWVLDRVLCARGVGVVLPSQGAQSMPAAPCVGPHGWLGCPAAPGLEVACAGVLPSAWRFASGAVFCWLFQTEWRLHLRCSLLSRGCIFLSFEFCKPVQDQLKLFTDQVLLLT